MEKICHRKINPTVDHKTVPRGVGVTLLHWFGAYTIVLIHTSRKGQFLRFPKGLASFPFMSPKILNSSWQ